MKRFLGVIPLILFLAGCGSDTPAAEKNLFSSWAATDSTFVLDISSGSFSTFSFTYLLTGGALCDCTLTMGGTQAAGTGVISGCSYRASTGGGSDPGCASLNATYTYTKDATTLRICNAGTCHNYI
jgi:hypothetical protein